jgi:hypothetical protein
MSRESGLIAHPRTVTINGIEYQVLSDVPLTDAQVERAAQIAARKPQNRAPGRIVDCLYQDGNVSLL